MAVAHEHRRRLLFRHPGPQRRCGHPSAGRQLLEKVGGQADEAPTPPPFREIASRHGPKNTTSQRIGVDVPDAIDAPRFIVQRLCRPAPKFEAADLRLPDAVAECKDHEEKGDSVRRGLPYPQRCRERADGGWFDVLEYLAEYLALLG